MDAIMTTTGNVGPIHHVYVCECCLLCGTDANMIFEAGGDPVTCKICGYPCNCPGCEAEHE